MKDLFKKIKRLPIKQSYLLFILVIGIIVTISMGTYAMFTGSNITANNVVTITTPENINLSLSNITEYKRLTIEAGEYKTIKLNITNDLSSGLYYGVWYEMVDPTTKGSDTTIAKLDTSTNPTSGTISSSTTTSLYLIIINDESTDITVNIGVASNSTSSLGLSTGRNLITDIASEPGDFSYTTTGIDLSSGKKYILSSYTCKGGATVTYDSTSNTVTYSKPDNCNLVFEEDNSLSTYIMNLILGSNSLPALDSGAESSIETTATTVVIHHPATTTTAEGYSYRYVGASPNNYITFNFEAWRIIGVENVQLPDGTYEYLTKIIRNNSIGDYSWDNTTTESSYGKNDWTSSRLMKLLNPGYEGESYGNSLYYSKTSGTCYSGQSNATTSCDFTSSGMGSSAKNYIETVRWKIGGWSSSDSLSSVLYSLQNGTTVYSGRPTYWDGRVGLMTDYDYVYAAGRTCFTGTIPSSYSSSCKSSDWLFNSSYQWTISPYSSYSDLVGTVFSDGGFGNGGACYAGGVRPVLYLKSETNYAGGSGTSSDPFTIS